MASNALPLRNAPQDLKITVDKLFATAFGASPAMYKHASLCGWRSLAPPYIPTPLLSTKARQKKKDWPTDKSPGISIYETSDTIVIEVELPEIKKNSLYLEISGDLLIIRGERLSTHSTDYNDLEQHRRFALVQRFIQLPVLARPKEVRAQMVGNIVKISISKQS